MFPVELFFLKKQTVKKSWVEFSLELDLSPYFYSKLSNNLNAKLHKSFNKVLYFIVVKIRITMNKSYLSFKMSLLVDCCMIQ